MAIEKELIDGREGASVRLASQANVQLFVNTWYHKFNERWHMATETYYEYMRDVPAVGGPLPTEPNANGADEFHLYPRSRGG